MKEKLILSAAVVALAAAGLADRAIRGNWESSSAIQDAVERLENLPETVGQWQGSTVSLDELVVEIAGCAGYKSLRFVHQETGHTVDMTVMVGIPGQMSEHAPEACYPGAGYTLDRRSWEKQQVAQFLGDSVPGELARMDFLRGDQPRPNRIWHGWFDGERWSRPDYPRLSFVRRQVLCRLQVAATLTPEVSDDVERLVDPGKEFLRDFLPVLTETLTADSESPVPLAKLTDESAG